MAGTTQPCTSLPVTLSQVIKPNIWKRSDQHRMSETTPLMIMTQSWPWGSKTAVKKSLPKWLHGFRAFFGFLHKLLQNIKAKYPRPKTPDTRWLLPINVGFTKNVLKSLNLIFSHVNFVYKIRKWNMSVNILFYYFPNFLVFWKIVFHLFCLHKVWKDICKVTNLLKSSIKH